MVEPVQNQPKSTKITDEQAHFLYTGLLGGTFPGSSARLVANTQDTLKPGHERHLKTVKKKQQ